MLAFLFACVHELPAPAAPTIEGADLLWFDLDGRDRIDLIEACWHDCPHDELDRPVASLTTWAVDWTWVRRPGDPCEVLEPTVVVDVTVTMPRWQPPVDADTALVDEWRTYLGALMRHEEGHVELVHRLADTTATTLRDAGCDGARDAGAGLIEDIRVAERAYDEETANGKRQGASFWGM
jgi:predicted secreted Zn-dependent protease